MIVYTAEDFAQANLATKGEFGVARRTDPRDTHQWRAHGEGRGWFSDEEMAADGWVPVVEGSETIAALRHSLAAARDEIVDLHWENHLLESGAEGVVSLGGLEAAWEAAEVPTDDNPIREGDVVIYTSACGTGVTVHKAAVGQFGREAHGYVRILSRAPKREPWADLADAINEASAQIQENIVRALHKRGVRVTGGEESEK